MRAVVASSRKRLAPARKKSRKEGEQLGEGAGMKKKLVLKSVVLEFNFCDEGGVPASSVGSRQEGASKRAKNLSLTGQRGTSVTKVSLPALAEVVIMPPLKVGLVDPIAAPVVTTDLRRFPVTFP